MHTTNNWLYIQYVDVVAYTPPSQSFVRSRPKTMSTLMIGQSYGRYWAPRTALLSGGQLEAKLLEGTGMASQRDIFVTFASAFLASGCVNSRPVESQPDEERDAAASCEQRIMQLSCDELSFK
jgi:hypothetical protein